MGDRSDTPAACPPEVAAAAADLLAVCVEYRDASETDDAVTAAARRGRLLAAISKATGGPSPAEPLLSCPLCGCTESVDPLPGTSGRRCVRCCDVTR